jgi:NADH-quinone oxidoreductase subunit C
MNPTQIAQHLAQKFGGALTESWPKDRHPRVHLAARDWRALAEHLHREPSLAFDMLLCLTGVDYVAQDQLAVVYDLRSSTHRHEFAIKVFTDRAAPAIPSVMDLWPAADWHEREAYDLLGIVFDGHKDLRRILLPEDWVGYPLRKDYAFPREYHGIPGTTELDWQQKPDYPM